VLDAAGTVYVGYVNGRLQAYYPDGTLKWSFPAASAVSSSPVMGADGTLYFGEDAGWVYALGPGTQ
jgi:outer membrane protein assembly factor BamB